MEILLAPEVARSIGCDLIDIAAQVERTNAKKPQAPPADGPGVN